MRAFSVFFALALFAMAAAQVNVVENNPEQVHFVDNNNPGQGNFGVNRPTPVHFVNNNRPGNEHFVNNDQNQYNNHNYPGQVNFVNNNPSDPTAVNFVNNNPSDPTAVHVVDNNAGQVNIINPDPGYNRPTYQQPDISPAYAPNNAPPRYPGKQYDNPYLRGGK